MRERSCSNLGVPFQTKRTHTQVAHPHGWCHRLLAEGEILVVDALLYEKKVLLGALGKLSYRTDIIRTDELSNLYRLLRTYEKVTYRISFASRSIYTRNQNSTEDAVMVASSTAWASGEQREQTQTKLARRRLLAKLR